MKNVLHNTKAQIAIILFLLFIFTSSHLGIQPASYLLLYCLGSTIVSDLIFTFIRRRKLFVPYGAIVTGLILTLIIDPSAFWWQILVIGAAAMAIKNFLRIGSRHVFNPAASGLLIGWALFGLNPSWWGPSFYSGSWLNIQNLLILVAVIGIFYVSGYRLKRYYSMAAYLVILGVLSAITSASFSPQSIFATLLSPGTLFYAFLMLPEPMTSPVNKKRQMIYGATVAVLFTVLVFIFNNTNLSNFNTPDASIVSLLIGNLLFFRVR
ncbi:MAG: RnfABCDGE type electron transport complex subunit D [Candidatus Levybacteria bacterium]|nr:RnfABCDGE type electron transport complex subunit D [Candidatus Levybacteria bacterium]